MCAPGSRQAVLQCAAFRGATSSETDARRPGVAGSARDPSCTETGTGGLLSLIMREQYRFSESAWHAFAKEARVSLLADHLDAVLAQTLATRAYQALNRVCLGKARRVRFKSRGRRLASIENKRNDTGLRFVLQKPQEGIRAFSSGKTTDWWRSSTGRIRWSAHGLAHRVKYVRLVDAPPPVHAHRGRVGRSLRCATGAGRGPLSRPNHPVGTGIIGVDLGPSTIASVPRGGSEAGAVL